MLQLRETRIIRSLPERVAPGVVIPEEGIPLSYVKVDGETACNLAPALLTKSSPA